MESEDEWTGSLNTCWLTAPACFARAFPTILITLFSVAEPVGVGMGNDPIRSDRQEGRLWFLYICCRKLF